MGWGDNAIPDSNGRPADLIGHVIGVYPLQHVPDFGQNQYSDKNPGRPNDGVVLDLIDFGMMGNLHHPSNVVVSRLATWMTGSLVQKFKGHVGKGPFIGVITMGRNKQGGQLYEWVNHHTNPTSIACADSWEKSLPGGVFAPSTPDSPAEYAAKAKAVTDAYIAAKEAEARKQSVFSQQPPQWAQQSQNWGPGQVQNWGPQAQQAPQGWAQQPQQPQQAWGQPQQPQQAWGQPQQPEQPKQNQPNPNWGGAPAQEPQQPQQQQQAWGQPQQSQPQQNPNWGGAAPNQTQDPASANTTMQAMMAAGMVHQPQQSNTPPF